MSEQPKHRDHDPAWDAWVAEACTALDVDLELVDVDLVLGVTKQIAHGFDRPMAPVGAYVLGLAVAQAHASGETPDLPTLRRRLVATLPRRSQEG